MIVDNIKNKIIHSILFSFFVCFVTSSCSSGQSGNRHITSEKKEGSFCERLRYIIIAGTEYFDPLKGPLIKNDLVEGSVTLPGSLGCAIDVSSSFDAEYICYFGDGNETKLPTLKATARQLERDVHSCIAVGNPFRYSDGERYENNGFLGYKDYSDDEFSIWFIDYWGEQEIHIRLRESNNRYSLKLEISSN